MLKAKKSFWFEKIFDLYNRNLLRRRFNSFRVLGLENLAQVEKKAPLIIYSNHSSWWDGLAAFHIGRRAGLDAFIMMEEKHLKNLRLFRRLGAFSVVRENPRKALGSIKYAAELLKEKKDRALWIFPQGEILPNDRRPVKFYNGVSRIVEKLNRCRTISLAMRYEFLGDFKPDIFVRIREAEFLEPDAGFDSKIYTEKLAENLSRNLDDLKKSITRAETKNFQNIL